MAAGQLRCAWGLGLSWRGAARPFCWRRISDDFWVLNLWNSGEWRHVLLSTNDMLYYAGLKHARIAFQNGSRVIVITTFYNITQARELRMHGFSRDPDPAWSRLLRVPLMPLRPRRADVEFYLNVAFTFKTHQNSITYYLPIKADLRWFVRCFQVFPGVCLDSECLQMGTWMYLISWDYLRHKLTPPRVNLVRTWASCATWWKLSSLPWKRFATWCTTWPRNLANFCCVEDSTIPQGFHLCGLWFQYLSIVTSFDVNDVIILQVE